MTVVNRIKDGDGDPRHGTIAGYTGHYCRCLLCQEAIALYGFERRAKLKGTLAADDPRHGRYTSYVNYSCRCDPCKAAWAAKCKRYDQGKRGHVPTR